VRTWKLTLEYDGTRYSGWQEQKNARTVMGDLRSAIEEVLRCPVDIQGSGRTDAGVHAAAQVAHLRANINTAPNDFIEQVNAKLPSDIAVYGFEEVPIRFHARHDALTRTYVYRIATRKTAFNKRYVWWVKQELDIGLMERAARLLTGRHDFACFRAPDPSKPGESSIVVVESAGIEVEDDGTILFRIEASHFLWRMVRRVVGVLVKLGKHEITTADFDQLLSAECDSRLDVAAWTAPASGLMLEHVRYS
jgi:tRNA pseudouridine38-40 synthase